jgi:hypothetical protein
MSGVSVLDLLLDLPEPHPALVAATTPTARQMAEAVFVLGLLPHDDDRLFRPAVSAHGGV